MAKKLLIEGGNDDTQLIPAIKGVRPSGSAIMVEMLNPDELLRTRMYVQTTTQTGCTQGYVIALGPKLTPEDAGLKVGDRVMLQGNYVPVPKYDDSHRERGMVELHNIKGIIIE